MLHLKKKQTQTAINFVKLNLSYKYPKHIIRAKAFHTYNNSSIDEETDSI